MMLWQLKLLCCRPLIERSRGCCFQTRYLNAVQGVRKLLEYLTPLGQKRDVSESHEQSGEAPGSEVAHCHLPMFHSHCVCCNVSNTSLHLVL